MHATSKTTSQHLQLFLVRLWTQNNHHPFMRQATTFQSKNSDDLGEDNHLAFWISLTDRGIWFWLPCTVNLCLEHKQFFMLNDPIWNIHFATKWKSFSWPWFPFLSLKRFIFSLTTSWFSQNIFQNKCCRIIYDKHAGL